MAGEITFTMIKPDAVSARNTGAIIGMMEKAGFSIIAMKLIHLTRHQAGQFYEVHKERPFYSSLCEYMSSGKIVAMILKKRNAVEDFRKLIGSTNPSDAAQGTIRKLYGQSIQSNAVHGSDSDDNAIKEAGFFFSELETSRE